MSLFFKVMPLIARGEKSKDISFSAFKKNGAALHSTTDIPEGSRF